VNPAHLYCRYVEMNVKGTLPVHWLPSIGGTSRAYRPSLIAPHFVSACPVKTAGGTGTAALLTVSKDIEA